MIYNRGHIVKFGNIDLTNYGVVEYVSCENLSSELLWFERALKPPKLKGRKFTLKQVDVQVRLINNNMVYDNNRIMENLTSELIGLLYSEEVQLVQWNNKYSWGVLQSATPFDILKKTSFLELSFVIVDGMWYSEIQNEQLGTQFTNDGLIDSNEGIITVNATSETVELKNGLGQRLAFNGLSTTIPLKIDLKNMTAKQGDVHVSMSLDSRFFDIKKGQNTFTITGGTGFVDYRKVVAL